MHTLLQAIRNTHIIIRTKNIDAIMLLVAGKDFMDTIRKRVPQRYKGLCWKGVGQDLDQDLDQQPYQQLDQH